MNAYIKWFKLDKDAVERLHRIARLATSVSHFDRMLEAQVDWVIGREAAIARAPLFRG